ncbi:Na+/H+ antiporter [Klebsiella pneumoniae]|uniref:Na+/H+ antiporter n=1 Tax=Klebsiella pneumoniae TaxID=573 RepID=A0A377WLQ0_KLEPN|nr:Na+/H+ antiporter [Klebsiella pneumoniae]
MSRAFLPPSPPALRCHYEQLSGPRLPATRMKSSAVWSMLQTTLNGMIFLMLGEQLPRMLRTLPAVASQAGVSSPWYLLLVRRGHHPGARSDALRLGMAVR